MKYSLYNTVAECFMITHTKYSIIKLAAALFSSRYNLVICVGNESITNENCLEYKIKGNAPGAQEYYNISEKPYQFDYVEQRPVDKLLITDKQYLEYTCRILETIQNLIELDALTAKEDLIGHYLDLKFKMNKVVQFKYDVIKIIYNEFDFLTAENKIKLLKDCNELNIP